MNDDIITDVSANDNQQPTLIVLLGPTAVGKTELSIRLAKLLSCDIMSADSRQIYKDISIGTAKPSPDELKSIHHHFIDILPLDCYYSAAQYEHDVLQLIASTSSPYHLMVGGSMMYIDAVTRGIDDIPTIHDDTREMMKERLEKEGADVLIRELRLIDPEYYKTVDLKNTKRIVHALEVCYQTGRTYTSFRTNGVKKRPFRIIKIGLRRERTQLFQRINNRVDLMMQNGLMDEAIRLYPLRHLNSLNTVGYKELFKVIEGEWQLPMAVERIKKNTRVYAKKQMTWFAHDTNIHWIDIDSLSVEQQLNEIQRMIDVDFYSKSN